MKGALDRDVKRDLCEHLGGRAPDLAGWRPRMECAG